MLAIVLGALAVGLLLWISHVSAQRVEEEMRQRNIPTTFAGWHNRAVADVDFVGDTGGALRDLMQDLPAIDLKPLADGDAWKQFESQSPRLLVSLDKALLSPSLTFRLEAGSGPLQRNSQTNSLEHPEIERVDMLGQLLLLRIDHLTRQGRTDAAAAACVELLKLSGYLRSLPDEQALAQMAKLRIAAAQAIERLINTATLTPPMLEQLKAAVEEAMTLRRTEDFRPWIDVRIVEAFVVIDQPGQTPDVSDQQSPLGRYTPGMITLQSAEVIDAYLDLHRYIDDRGSLGDLSRRVALRRDRTPDISRPLALAHRAALGDAYTPEHLVPDTAAAINLAVEAQTRLTLVDLALDIELYHYLHKQLPRSLVDLRRTEAADPYSDSSIRFTERKVSGQVSGGAGESGQAYALRSAGFDGKFETNDDVVFTREAPERRSAIAR